MTTPELTVMGAGIFGLSVAWAAARRGARVRVIDPGGIGAGASGGLVGALTPFAPDRWTDAKAFQLDCLLAAPDWWAAVTAAGDVDPGFARTGRLSPLPDAAAVASAHQRAAGAALHWQGRAEWQVIAATGDPRAPVSATGLLAHDTLSARINPRRALASLAAAIHAAGGEIVTDGAAAGPVVWATGVAGLADLSDSLGRRIGGGEKGQAALLAHAAPGAPQIAAPGLYIVPHADGTVAIGSTAERAWNDATRPDALLDALIDRARTLCPALADAPVIQRWAALRPRAASRAPVLGPWPGRTGHFIANGGFKIGFGLAPGVAGAMADLVLDGQDRIPEGFRVESLLAAR